MARTGSKFLRIIIGVATILTVTAGVGVAEADDDPMVIALTALTGQKAKSVRVSDQQLALVRSRLDSTRTLRTEGRNLNSSSLAMRFSGGSKKESAAFHTKHLLAPEKERRTRRAAVWFAGDMLFDSTRAEDPYRSALYSDGLAFGADVRVGPRLLVGSAVGVAFDRKKVGTGGSLEARYLSNTLYGSLMTSRDSYLDVAVGASASTFLSHHAGLDAPSGGNTSGRQFFGQARYSHQHKRGRFRIRSYGQARVQEMRVGGYTKGDGGTSRDPEDAGSLGVTLGVRGETSRTTKAGRITPHAVLEVSSSLTQTSGTIITSTNGFQERVVAPSSSYSDRFAARAGLNWAINDSATVKGEYSALSAMAEFNPQQKVTARFELQF